MRISSTPTSWKGRSPRVRGKPDYADACEAARGSIPACAGETSRALACSSLVMVDPRVCGGNVASVILTIPRKGRSPRVRGKQNDLSRISSSPRSIPACAGETAPSPLPILHSRSIPACAGETAKCSGFDRRSGSIPACAGETLSKRPQKPRIGSIPACAGETTTSSGYPMAPWVDPRVCGGNFHVRRRSRLWNGRSPRVRGKPVGLPGVSTLLWSIPACAGETVL